MITIDDGTKKVRMEDFGFRVLMEHKVAHTASISTATQSIPGIIGLIPVKQQIGSKTIAISLRRLDKDEITANYQTDRLLDVLFDDLYQPKPLKVIMDYDKDKYMNVYVSGDLESVRRSIISEMPLSFVAYDPRRYSIVNADEITWGSELLTFESMTYMFGHVGTPSNISITGNRIIRVDVIGLALQPEIKLNGSAKDLIITCNEKEIKVGDFTNANWFIDTEKYVAYKNGVETILNMDKFLLRAGENRIFFTGREINLEASFAYRERWK